MKSFPKFNRRGILTVGIGLLAGGCDRFASSTAGQKTFDGAETLSYKAQRLLIGGKSLAPEFTEADISTFFKPNGSIDPKDTQYRRLVRDKFVSWKLTIDGLVATPRSFTLADLRALPARTQNTRHDCVEGWSCIAKWKGPPLSVLLDAVKPKPEARFVVFHCFDSLGADQTVGSAKDQDADESDDEVIGTQPRYYESIDFVDARHPQTILAYEMNDAPLPVAHGAPLRVRIERQLGYKMAKYISRIEIVDDLSSLGEGRGGYWEDLGYDWYAGV